MGFFFDDSKKETCSICGEKFISCYCLKDKNKICKNCIKKLGGFWKSNWVNMTREEVMESLNKQSNQFDGAINIVIDSNINLIEGEQKKYILGEERYYRDVKLKELKNRYKDYTNKQFKIHEELMYSNLYSKAINQKNIFNKYSDKYIDLCNQLLQILPETLEYDKEEAKISKLDRVFNYCDRNITNMIRLLEKQEKYNEIINVSRYLLSLGITEDGTKKGIKGRIEKAITKFNEKFNTNYIYKPDENLIIDTNTGEIME